MQTKSRETCGPHSASRFVRQEYIENNVPFGTILLLFTVVAAEEVFFYVG